MKFINDLQVDFRSVADRITDQLKASGLVSDTNTGSITQMLAETFAIEMSTFYSVLEKAHEAGYLNSAEGSALDEVVAILGLERIKPGKLAGNVVFSRSVPATSDIIIPERTRVTGAPLADVEDVPLFETGELVRIPAGQLSVSVSVHEIGENAEIESLPVGALNIMPRPILGIETVRNPTPIMKGNQAEDDKTLRIRAGAALKENQKCTLESLAATAKGFGIQTVKVFESSEIPGCIEVHLGDPGLEKEPKRVNAVKKAIQNAKAAGIHVDFKILRTMVCRPTIVVKLEKEFEDMEDNTFHVLAEKLKKIAADFINDLGAGDSVPREKMKNALLIDRAVEDVGLTLQTFPLIEMESGVFKERADPWTMDVLDKAIVDQEKLPITILRQYPLRASVNMILTVAESELSGEQDELDELKLKIRALVNRFIEILLPVSKSDSESVKFHFDELLAFLKKEMPQPDLNLELAWIIHQDSGEVVDLKAKMFDEFPFEEQLSSGSIEVIKKGEDG